MSYYKVIDGVKYDKGLLEDADEKVAGKGDGRVSQKDAEELIEAANDGGRITKIELQTLEYIRKNYTFTGKAGEWFDAKVAEIAAS